jgi:tryptophan-rich sensory protein
MSLTLFILSVLGCGILIGFLCPPGQWYARLKKPSFNPPDWAFAPAWTLLYVLIAIAGWRTWENGAPLTFSVWIIQLLVNYSWSPLFFRAHRAGLALALILVLLALIAVFIALQWNADRLAALLFIPYAAWVAFASTLNAALLRLNGTEVRS